MEYGRKFNKDYLNTKIFVKALFRYECKLP